MNRKRTLLQIPQGTESVILEEAYIHRKITGRLGELYESWGYLPAQIPVIDFYDIYRPLLDEASAQKIYRLIDREGDLLMLRSDITMFLAKQTGLSITEEDLPVRVWYGDAILRHQELEDISKNEFFQTGIELIGKRGMPGDLEVLMLLAKTLETAGLKGSFIHIGSRALFESCFAQLSAEKKKKIGSRIINREPWIDLIDKDEDSIPDAAALLFQNLFQFIGDSSAYRDFCRENSENLPQEAAGNMLYIKTVIKELEEFLKGDNLRIDLSEIGTQPYYTGIVFQVYMDGLDSAIASGGRYDELLGSFGFDCPSVGFSLLQRKIEPFIGNPEELKPHKEIIHIDAGSFKEAYLQAEEERRKGKIPLL